MLGIYVPARHAIANVICRMSILIILPTVLRTKPIDTVILGCIYVFTSIRDCQINCQVRQERCLIGFTPLVSQLSRNIRQLRVYAQTMKIWKITDAQIEQTQSVLCNKQADSAIIITLQFIHSQINTAWRKETSNYVFLSKVSTKLMTANIR